MKLANLYGSDMVAGLMEGFKCANCTLDATKRCKRCAQVWYCSKECQVAHWKEHRKVCRDPNEVKIVSQTPIVKGEKPTTQTKVETKPPEKAEAEMKVIEQAGPPKIVEVNPEPLKEEKVTVQENSFSNIGSNKLDELE